MRYAKSLVALTREANPEDDSRGLFRVRWRRRPSRRVHMSRLRKGKGAREREEEVLGSISVPEVALSCSSSFSHCSCLEKLLRPGSEKLLCLTNRRPFPLNRECQLRFATRQPVLCSSLYFSPRPRLLLRSLLTNFPLGLSIRDLDSFRWQYCAIDRAWSAKDTRMLNDYLVALNFELI